MKKIFIILILGANLFGFNSCVKFLDKKPNKALTTPQALKDYEALLNLNSITESSTPEVGDLGSDDYYVTSDLILPDVARRCYSWQTVIFPNLTDGADWSESYSRIYTSNVVIEGLNDYEPLSPQEQQKWNNIMGYALFLRAKSHFDLEEIFGPPYRVESASTDIGIPLKVNSDLEGKAVRATVAKVYDQIINDLEKSLELVNSVTATPNWPSKATVYSILARVYLSRREYQKAGDYADKSLQIKGDLFDFNALNPGSNSPFNSYRSPNDFPEVLYPCTKVNYGVFYKATAIIDTNLYNSYDNDDLRKGIYFRKNNATGTYFFKGTLSGNPLAGFSGPTVGEMYLIRAEGHARGGDKNAALSDLNTLMQKRWKNTVTYPQIDAIDAVEAL